MSLFMFILGINLGSFLNVCIFRIPNQQSIFFPPSACNNCKKRIKLIDLIPIISYFLLKGKCRMCGAKISIKYPLIELFTGIIFLVIYLFIGLQSILLKLLVLVSILIVVVFIDIEHQIIPDKIVIFSIITGIILNIYVKDVSLFSAFMGFLLGGGILFFIALVTNGAMGGGDIKLMAAMGLFLGWKATWIALLLAFFLGGIIGLLLIATKRKSRKDYVPFAPFLALGSIAAILFYEEIILGYLLIFI